MRERPISLKPDLVRAFLRGEKSQTRRIIKPQPAYGMDGFTGLAHNVRAAIWRSGMPTPDLCPYGKPGDRLWVKEQLRITLEITEVRAQWLQDITEEDAQAEGVKPWAFNPDQPLTSGERAGDSPYRSGFAYKWDCINGYREGGKYLWKNNPAVWALTLKQVTA